MKMNPSNKESKYMPYVNTCLELKLY